MSKMTEKEFSVLITVYEGDNPTYFQTALESVFSQTVRPAEVIIVTDGPLTDDLTEILNSFRSKYSKTVEVVSLTENRGLGAALRTGLEACSYDLIARMDADDVCVSDRFEQQLEYLEANPDIDVVGGFIAEFSEDPEKAERVRKVPTDPDQVRSTSRFRCPVNHPTVMFRRRAVMKAGNYREFRSMQDYELWMRMLSKGYQIANIDTVLVKFRTEGSLNQRRGGIEYAQTEVEILSEFYRMGAISLPVFLLNIIYRIPIRFLPSSIRARVYDSLLRE